MKITLLWEVGWDGSSTLKLQAPRSSQMSVICVMDYFTRLSVSDTIQRRMIEWLVNNELERIWKEVVVVQSRYYLRNFLEGLRKATVNLIRILCVLAAIWTELLPNTSPEHYRYVSQIGKSVTIYQTSRRQIPYDIVL
jgi:hypothetical protein